jgi:hypothetical protein
MGAVHGKPHIDQPLRARPDGSRAGGGPAGGENWRRACWIAAAGVVAAGAALRILAARGDLWLDEIWSLGLAREAGSAWRVFTAIHHDNNHHLSTLWMLALGPSAQSLAYRALAVAAGAATLALVALRPMRLGSGEAFAWLSLLAFSWILVHYASEARGYAPAMLFAVAAFVSLDRFLETGRRSWAAAFSLSAVLGLLSHLTFLYAFLAFAAWAAAAWIRDRATRRPDAALLAAFAVPAAAFAALWAVSLRQLVVGGGPEYRTWAVLRELLRASLGLPRGPLELLGLVALAGAANEIRWMIRQRRPEAAFFLAVLLVAPGLVLAWSRPEYLAPRYFVVAVPFFLLLVGRSLARLWRRAPWGRVAASAAMAVFCAGSGFQVARLLRDGRGHYREAVELIVRSSPPGDATVGSDHEWRNPVVLDHYARQVAGAGMLAYVPSPEWPWYAPLWFLRHDLEEDPRPPGEMVGPRGRRYTLVRQFPSAPMSGWHWQLYRRDGPP